MEIPKEDQAGRYGRLRKKSIKAGVKTGFKPVSTQKIRSVWVKKALVLWGKIVVARDGECQWCFGKKCNNYRLGGHHIVARSITKQQMSAWFDLRNGMCLGWWCHDNIKHDPDDYIKIRDVFLKKRNLEYDYLKTILTIKGKLSLADIKVIYGQFERECIKKKLI